MAVPKKKAPMKTGAKGSAAAKAVKKTGVQKGKTFGTKSVPGEGY